MPLLPSEIFCRFIRPKDWSKKFKRPTPQAFKQEGLSVWYKGWLDKKSVPLEELQVGSLEGSGQAFHTVQDYFDCAIEAEAKSKPNDSAISLSVEVVHRPEHVESLWEKWKDAHYEIEASVNLDPDPTACLQVFRNLLASKARYLVPPEEYKEG